MALARHAHSKSWGTALENAASATARAAQNVFRAGAIMFSRSVAARACNVRLSGRLYDVDSTALSSSYFVLEHFLNLKHDGTVRGRSRQAERQMTKASTHRCTPGGHSLHSVLYVTAKDLKYIFIH